MTSHDRIVAYDALLAEHRSCLHDRVASNDRSPHPMTVPSGAGLPFLNEVRETADRAKSLHHAPFAEIHVLADRDVVADHAALAELRARAHVHERPNRHAFEDRHAFVDDRERRRREAGFTRAVG